VILAAAAVAVTVERDTGVDPDSCMVLAAARLEAGPGGTAGAWPPLAPPRAPGALSGKDTRVRAVPDTRDR
jgi:hypothetical protein